MLYIYSNTKLILDKETVIIGGLEENKYHDDLIKGSHVDSKGNYCGNEGCKHGEHSQWKNITIEGGIWDCNNPNDPNIDMVGAFLFRHGTGLTIKDLTIKNSTGHTINPSASEDILISGVTIKDARASTKADFTVEAIHLDSANTGEQTAYPVDGTGVEDVTIQNCTFDNVYSGIGSHSIYRTAKGDTLSSNIKILNNTFKNIKCYCINAISFRNMTIQGNKASGKNEKNIAGNKKGYAFIYTRNSTGSKVVISSSTANGGNKVINFEYPIVKYNFKVDNYSDEVSNNLTSNRALQPSFICIDYTANGGTGSEIRKKVNIITNKSQTKSFTLADNTFTRTGYKFKNWKVTLNEGTGEKTVGTYNPGTNIDTTDLRWHHTTYKVYAQWTKLNSISLSTKPTKVNYTVGDELSLTGGKITAKYADGTSTTVSLTNSKVKVSGYDKTKIGNQTLTIEYEGVKTTYTVNVKQSANMGPTLTITSNSSTAKTETSTITYTFTWSEKVVDFDVNDIEVTNGTKGKFTALSGGKKYTLVVTTDKDCEQTVSVKAYKCKDVSGNLNTTGSSLTISIHINNRTAVESKVSGAKVTVTKIPNGNNVQFIFQWDSVVTGFDADDIEVIGGTKGKFSTLYPGRAYQLMVTKTSSNIDPDVRIEANKCMDSDGEGNQPYNDEIKIKTGDTKNLVDPNIKRPKVSISAFEDKNSNSTRYVIQFDTNVTGFDINDITVTNGIKGTFMTLYSGRAYQLFVKKSSSGAQTVKVNANVCTDKDGVGNEASEVITTTIK